MAKLIENTQRGVFRITSRGKEVLKGSPQKIDINDLSQFPEYAERREAHRQKYKKSHEKESSTEPESSPTPEEQIEEAYENLRETLSTEILAQSKIHQPHFSSV
jgi:restriction system protein